MKGFRMTSNKMAPRSPAIKSFTIVGNRAGRQTLVY